VLLCATLCNNKLVLQLATDKDFQIVNRFLISITLAGAYAVMLLTVYKPRKSNGISLKNSINREYVSLSSNILYNYSMYFGVNFRQCKILLMSLSILLILCIFHLYLYIASFSYSVKCNIRLGLSEI
jgi:hypothetical protein